MNKQDKQLEKQLIKKLTENCEDFKSIINGFSWLTHTLNFSNVNQSIKIICVFDTNEAIAIATQKKHITVIRNEIINTLNTLKITLKKPSKQIVIDSEENCDVSHNGNWQKRLSQQSH